MKSRLAENIKTFRKERKMTQEQLAEAMGVTVGAVYKWESKQSNPDLNLIIGLADLFEVSQMFYWDMSGAMVVWGQRLKGSLFIARERNMMKGLWNQKRH